MAAIRRFLVIVTVSLLVVRAFGASLLVRRAIPDDVEPASTKSVEICQKSTPCGWAVYTKYTRVIEYFMKNQCECAENKRCIRTDDDISVSAYVYRCKDHNPKDENNNS